MQLALWPLVPRESLVRVFRPGDEATSEGPFRTLRRRKWATAGVRIATRVGDKASGQVTVFSALNIEAARLGRCARPEAAARLAAEAEKIEAGRDFARLRRLLSGLSPDIVSGVARGVLPAGFSQSDKVWSLLTKIARRTERLINKWPSEVVLGRVSAVRDTSVVLETVAGERSVVPRWLATSAHRAHVGDDLAVLTDRLGESSVFAVAFPAIDVERPKPAVAFDPFARDPRVGALTMRDLRKLSGDPAPPRVLVPVSIEG